MRSYLWQLPTWPHLTWNAEELLKPLASVRRLQGGLLCSMENAQGDENLRLHADIIEEDAIHTAKIEGEILDRQRVRSSIAKHLGLSAAGLPQPDRAVDGLVEVLLDATHHCTAPLSKSRLCNWHAALFPSGHSGSYKITVGDWRHEDIQVISGAYGKQKIHYEGPPPEVVEQEMAFFFHWWENLSTPLDGIIRAALAHLYFVTIHPFDDGNGRLARTIADMALAQDEGTKQRYYSMSAQIMAERNVYYEILHKIETGNGDCTEWLIWFIKCMERSILNTKIKINTILQKSKFWTRHLGADINVRQRKVLNRLLDAGKDGFEGGLTTRKYAGIAKASRATAWREIEHLLNQNMLRKLPGEGRNTAYEIDWCCQTEP